jgi:hypothetical protein
VLLRCVSFFPILHVLCWVASGTITARDVSQATCQSTILCLPSLSCTCFVKWQMVQLQQEMSPGYMPKLCFMLDLQSKWSSLKRKVTPRLRAKVIIYFRRPFFLIYASKQGGSWQSITSKTSSYFLPSACLYRHAHSFPCCVAVAVAITNYACSESNSPH